MTALIALAAGLGLAAVVGGLLTRRGGTLRETRGATPTVDAAALGLSTTGPTIVHFSAPWCGPCAAVRRVVDQVCAEFDDTAGHVGSVGHVEIDIDADPVAAKQLSILSLPTTFIFDAAGQQRYRAAGVPTVDDLRSALRSVLT